MRRWVVVGVLAALAVAAGPRDGGRLRRARRARRSSTSSRGGAMTANTGGTTIQGRVAAGGDARVQSITIGTNPPLTPNAYRVDLVVGRNLTVDGGGGSVPNGAVTYGGTLTPTGTLTALGGLHPASTAVRLRGRGHHPERALGAVGGPRAERHHRGAVVRRPASPAPTRCATCSPSPPRSCRARGRSPSTSRPARRRSSTCRDRPSRARCTGSRWSGPRPRRCCGTSPSPPRCSRPAAWTGRERCSRRTRRSASPTATSTARSSPTA